MNSRPTISPSPSIEQDEDDTEINPYFEGGGLGIGDQDTIFQQEIFESKMKHNQAQ